ncbi:hypothetical protein AJ79_04151 [Helicocarpus griseus UAMH5409]|uniref:Endochitinase 2 n=1 Tax=Helicocarpus griseus UAMH5409 TaxID=1447875 RepID=A0A2B7XV56_9EURO|nr:hypothetical protein AJ79_04151 [Helicocarpus griseus UAMH5409]
MTPGNIFTAAVAAVSLLASSTFALDPNSKTNLAVYYGQGAYQKRLRHFCEQTSLDIIPLSFVHIFPDQGKGGYPGTNFGNQCNGEVYLNEDGVKTDLLSGCHQIAEDIPICQAAGKTILLSLGGATDTYKIESTKSAVEFADFLWGAFGPKTKAWGDKPRPFGDVVIDGFDFDIEHNGSFGYTTMVHRLRALFEEDSSKKYYISAAPQCVPDDRQLAVPIVNSYFDFIFVQFYNTAACSARSWVENPVSSGFSFGQWVDVVKRSPNPSAKIYVGLPASTAAAIEGFYLTPSEVHPLVETYMNKYPAHFGGIMLWEATQSDNNKVNGKSYADNMKEILYKCSPPVTTTTRITATSTSTSTIPTSSSTKTSTTTPDSPTTTTRATSSSTKVSTRTPITESTTASTRSPTKTGTTTPCSSVTPTRSATKTGTSTPCSSITPSAYPTKTGSTTTPCSSITPSGSATKTGTTTTPCSSVTPSGSATKTGTTTTPCSSVTPSGNPTKTGTTTPCSSASPTGTTASSSAVDPTHTETKSTPDSTKTHSGSSTASANPTGTTKYGTSSLPCTKTSSVHTPTTRYPVTSTTTVQVTVSPYPTAPLPEPTTTVIVTSYTTICPTGLTTVTTTYTTTYCPGTACAYPTGSAGVEPTVPIKTPSVEPTDTLTLVPSKPSNTPPAAGKPTTFATEHCYGAQCPSKPPSTTSPPIASYPAGASGAAGYPTASPPPYFTGGAPTTTFGGKWLVILAVGICVFL